METSKKIFHKNVIIFDVETTGKYPKDNKMVQIALVKVKEDGLTETRVFYFNPNMSREKQMFAFHIHKISPDKLLYQKPFSGHAEEILDFMSDVTYLAGHNVLFDWNFLYREFERLEEEQVGWLDRLMKNNFVLLDTYKMSMVAFPNLPRVRLQDVASHLNIEISRQSTTKYQLSSPSKKEKVKVQVTEDTSYHDAVTDAMATKEVLHATLRKLMSIEDEQPMKLSSLNAESGFIYQPKDLILIDKSMSESITDDTETKTLLEVARGFVSKLRDSRGKHLKDIHSMTLRSEANFLTRSLDSNDQRGRILREIILDDRQKEKEEPKNGKDTEAVKRKADENNNEPINVEQKKVCGEK